MGAGGSTHTPRPCASPAALPTRFRVQDLSTISETELKGVGTVVGPEEVNDGEQPPQPEAPDLALGQQFAWFAEDLSRPGHWNAYNEESSIRLEQAFLLHQPTCTVAVKKFLYQVDMHSMEQLPSTGSSAGGQAQRKCQVRRALAEAVKDPSTGEMQWKIMPARVSDPFEDSTETEESTVMTKDCETAADIIIKEGVTASGLSVSRGYPQLIHAVQPQVTPIYALALTPSEAELAPDAKANGRSGVLAVTGGKGGSSLVEWNVDTGCVVARYQVQALRPVSILSAAYSPTGSYILVGVDDHAARLFRVGEVEPVKVLKGHEHKVYGVAFLSTETQILTGSMDCYVKLWDLQSGNCVRSERAHTSHVFSVAASRRSPYLATSVGDDAIVCVHDFRLPNSVVMRLCGHTQTLWDCAIRDDDTQLASCGMDSTVRLWDPRRPLEVVHTITHHTNPVHSVHYTPAGRGILSCGKDSAVMLSDTSDGKMVWRAKAHNGSVFRVVYHADRQMLFTCGVKGDVNEWAWPAGDGW